MAFPTDYSEINIILILVYILEGQGDYGFETFVSGSDRHRGGRDGRVVLRFVHGRAVSHLSLIHI